MTNSLRKKYFFPILLLGTSISHTQFAYADLSLFTNNANPPPIRIGLSALFAAGGASVGEATISDLQGGGHDPNRNGFTVQNIELSIGGAVDPFFDGQASIIYQIDDQGETVIEVEEVYALSKRLPYGLQLKAGQYFTEFGRLNNQHPHTWAFSDQPIILTRLFGGDGIRSQGVRLAWLSPLPWYSEFYAGIQNARSETTTSFISSARTENTDVNNIERSINGPEDFLYSARWLNGFDVNDSISTNLGASALWGPNSTGDTNKTSIYGIDFYAKWQAEVSQAGFPFITWHTEYLTGNYDVSNASNKSSWKDNGWFSQLSYGYRKGWIAGLRLEQVSSNSDDATDPNRDSRNRTALNLTWLPTEYSKLRLQYNADHPEHLSETAHSIWLQFEFNLGSHAAHTF